MGGSHVPSCRPQGLTLLWAIVLLAPEAGTSELPKALVTLDPPWMNVIQEDWVTLHCQGPHSPEDPDTLWFHDDIPVGAEGPRSLRFQASINSSGGYRCQTRRSRLSDPVRLEVYLDWLLLQTPALEFQEGDPIVLRCHSWRNKTLVRVTFFQDGESKSFSHGNRNFSIPQANSSHSGQYHCRGFIGKTPHTSMPVVISVRGRHQGATGPGPDRLSVSLLWPHVAVYLAVTVFLAVDTGLYLCMRRDLWRGPRGAQAQCASPRTPESLQMLSLESAAEAPSPPPRDLEGPVP